MADMTTIASLATAGGTLVLAAATFFSTRSANRAARVAERSFQAGLRPVIFNARRDDLDQKVEFGDGLWLKLHNGMAEVQQSNGNVYLAMPLRNVGNGLGVLRAWHLSFGRPTIGDTYPPLEEFHPQQRDLYVPAGDIGFWQGAIRDASDAQYPSLKQAVETRDSIIVDLLYGDHEGGQRTITRFRLAAFDVEAPSDPQATQRDPNQRWCTVIRHWNLDGPDPR
jgi:hypothetical protein